MARQTVTHVLTAIALLGTVVLGQSSTSSKAAADKASASAKASADKWSVPRTPDGHPDFHGVWANNGMTPLERPKQFGLRTTMTDAELADLKKRATTLIDGGDAFFADELITAAIDGKTKFSSSDTQVGNYDQTWLSDRVWDNRTSLIVDPPDGRIPALAPGAAERARAQAVASAGGLRADGVELEWRFTDPAVVAADGLVPFLIDWGTSPHPALSAPDGAVLLSVRAEHPHPSLVERYFRVIDVEMAVSQAVTPALIARVRTRSGEVELR